MVTYGDSHMRHKDRQMYPVFCCKKSGNLSHNLPRSCVDSTRWSQILAENRDFCLPLLEGSRRNIAMAFGTEKLEWRGYPMVKKFGIYVYSFRQNTRTWQTDGRTDRQTDRQTDTAWRHNNDSRISRHQSQY